MANGEERRKEGAAAWPQIKSVADAFTWSDLPEADEGLQPKWYRGHRSDNWILQPSIMRPTQPDALGEREWELLERFMRGAPSRYANCPPPFKDTESAGAQWLSLARQYGLPTRLLDWSESILVALYFAVEKADTDGDVDGALWTLSPREYNFNVVGTSDIPTLGSGQSASLVHAAFSRRGGGGPPVACAAPEFDTRLFVQQCGYTIHGGPTPFEEPARNHLRRATIPAGNKGTIRTELNRAGIHLSTLFPDLANLAKELREAGQNR